jgi:hypothetical protein
MGLAYFCKVWDKGTSTAQGNPATAQPKEGNMLLASSSSYRILADRADGSVLECFTWRKSPEAGIERAKRDAVAFGFAGLTNFRAELFA